MIPDNLIKNRKNYVIQPNLSKFPDERNFKESPSWYRDPRNEAIAASSAPRSLIKSCENRSESRRERDSPSRRFIKRFARQFFTGEKCTGCENISPRCVRASLDPAPIMGTTSCARPPSIQTNRASSCLNGRLSPIIARK